MFRALEVEKMKDMAALRLQIREERKALKEMPGSRPLSYRAWVEMQATKHDAAAISQLRGWAYREKRNNRTAAISGNIILNSVADDIRPAQIRGYETQVNRDGAVVYSSGGNPVLLDRGLLIEVAMHRQRRVKTSLWRCTSVVRRVVRKLRSEGINPSLTGPFNTSRISTHRQEKQFR